MLSDSDIYAQVTQGDMIDAFRSGFDLPPLNLRLKQLARDRSKTFAPDAILTTTWENDTFEFDAELKTRSTPKAFIEAVRQIQGYAEQSPRLPLIVLPYLRSNQLDELTKMKISGIDLCGNGVIVVPRRLLVLRTGNPNKYRLSPPTKFAYRGTTSLVARAFLCRTSYGSLAQIEEEIRKRGGRISLPTISKALSRMAEDVLVSKTPGKIELLQPEPLLDKLLSNFQPPQIRLKARCATELSLSQLMAIRPRASKVVFTGTSSIDKYGVMGRVEPPILYTDSLADTLGAWGERIRQTSRFWDLELRETLDPTPYFDSRLIDGMPYASPVQTFLECAKGEKREREIAEQVRKRILEETRFAGDSR